ncbi:MAG: SAM-dependent methyltransferase, partial [Spirochaetota bacterium]
MAFDQNTRNRLQKFVGEAKDRLIREFTRQLQNDYGMDPGTGEVSDPGKLTHLDDEGMETALLLRDSLAHYLASSPTSDKKDVLDRIVREQAFTVLNRLCALRMAEARDIIIESISNGYNSKGFQLYFRLAGSSLGEIAEAYKCYLFSLFDEFAVDLAVLFDRYSPMGRLFPRDTVLIELLDKINHSDLANLWGEDETIGWVYQYFNSKEERKKMRDESAAPRNSRELAVRNQFFTPRYVVEFLTDNTLGRIWYE